MTRKSIKEIRVERLRKSFIRIVKELNSVKNRVDENIRRLKDLKNCKIRNLVYIGLGREERESIRADFEIHYRKGLKILKLIDRCGPEIENYNNEYQKLRAKVELLLMEKLPTIGVKIEPSENKETHACYDPKAGKVLFIKPEECRKLTEGYIILTLDNHVEAVLVRLNAALEVTGKEEQELSEELFNLYEEIRSSEEFTKSIDRLNEMAVKVECCLNELYQNISKLIKDIMKEYCISEQDLSNVKLKLV